MLYDQLLANLASCEILALGRFCWDLAVLGPSRPLTNTPQYRPQARLSKRLRRNPPEVGVTSGQKPSTKIIYIVL